jgi:hemoglobin/transferrin/lactoferrin receptor protein
MKKFPLILLLLLSAPALFAQEVMLIDRVSRQPLQNVSLSNLNGTSFTLTNEKGKASLESFGEGDYILFQHPAYQDVTYTYKAIQQQNFVVALLEEVLNMQEVVVAANRWEQSPEEIPQDIVTVSAREIAFQNPQTAADLLQNTGEIYVQKSQQGGGSPMLRGFAANSVLLVVDGIRMNNAIYRSGNLQNVINLDPNILEGAEVVFGPGSVLYGSDALGGVMDFHTKTPPFSGGDKMLVQGSAFARYASANNEKTAHIDLSLGGKKLSSLSSLTYSDFGDLRSGSNYYEDFPDFGKRLAYVQTNFTENGSFEDVIVPNDEPERQKFSGYKQLNFLQKLHYRPADLIDLTYSFHYSTSSNIPRYDRLIERQEPENPASPFSSAEWYYGPQQWMLHSLQAGFFSPTNWYSQAKITAGFQHYEESRNDRKFENPQLRSRTEAVNMYSLNADFDKEFSPLSQLFYGLEGIANEVDSYGETVNIVSGESEPVAPRYPDGGSQTYSAAAYASYKYQLRENLIANAGARYTLYRLRSELTDTFYDFPFEDIKLNTSALNGNLGLVYKPAGWKFSTFVSTGFRAPNVDDVAKVFDSEPGVVVVPNPNLKPEYTYNLESSVSYGFKDKLQLQATAYLTWLTDAMVRRDFAFNGQDSIIYDGEPSKVEALVNTNKAIIYGVSSSLRLLLYKGLSFSQQITYTDGEDLSEQVPLRHTPPLFGKSTLKYQAKGLKGELFVIFNGAKEWEELAPSEQAKTHLYTSAGSLTWHTWNIRLSYQFNKHLQLNAGLENIFDKHYRPYSSGISAAGRNLYVTLRAYL